MIGEDEAARAVEGAGGDQELVVEHEAHRHGGEAGVGVEDRDHGRHVGAADRDDQQHAEGEGQHDDDREDRARPRRGRVEHQRDAGRRGDTEQRQVGHVLQRIGDRPLRDPLDLLELAGRHQAAGEGEEAEDDLDDDGDHAERRQVLGRLPEPEVELGRAHQAGGQSAERVRQRGPLRHGRERHPRQRHADQDAGRERQHDPAVVNDFRLRPRGGDREHHAGDAGVHAVPRRGRRVHPVQREDEQARRDDVGELHHAVAHG